MVTHATPAETAGEWTAACEVQQRFMHHPGPKRNALDYHACCRQMQAVGGDFYSFEPLADSHLAFAVGDASGKGLAAALMIANVQSSLRTASFFAANNSPAVLDVVNRQVYESSLADRYATLFYGVFDGSARILRYVNAGHNPPFVMRGDKSVVWLETGGAPVGMFPDWKYEEGVLHLSAGDVIIAYTDGVTEATNANGAEWGTEALVRAAAESSARCADDMVESILTSLNEFTRGLQIDDATVVALQVH